MEYTIIDTSKVLAVVCAGGDGTRIEPLSRFRAKPAIPIGGNHRLVDVMLSNLLNSAITHIYVIVQRRPQSLIRHLEGYTGGVAQMRGQFLRVLAPPKEEDRFFLSDADSLLQLRGSILSNGTEIIVVVMADQVVKIDFRQVIWAMLQAGADAVMVHRAVPLEQARGQLGVLELSREGFVSGMEEKPAAPLAIPGQPERCYANLAMYVFRRQAFTAMLDHIAEHHQPESTLSRSGIPWIAAHQRVLAYDLLGNAVPGVASEEQGYFADTGTVDAWYGTQLAMCQRLPVFNFYSRAWPIYTAAAWPMSPAKFDEVARVNQALFGPNAICQDGVAVERSVVSSGAIVGQRSGVVGSVILNDVVVGAGCRLERVVVDKDVQIPDGVRLSPANPPAGTIRSSTLFQKIKGGETVENTPVLTDGGILVFPKGYQFK